MIRTAHAAFILVFSLFSAALAWSQPIPLTITTINNPGWPASYPYGVNNAGEVVGYSQDTLLNTQAFIYSKGVYSSLIPPGSYDAVGEGVNSNGQIAGFYQNAGYYDECYYACGFVYDPVKHTFNNLNAPFLHADATLASGINDSGQVVGAYDDNNVNFGFFYDTANFVSLVFPGSSSSHAWGINNSGQIVGDYTDSSGTHGFLYLAGQFTTIDAPGSVYTSLGGINNSGQIVGVYQSNTDGNYYGLVWNNGVFVTFTVPGATATSPNAINDQGEIVGNDQIGQKVSGFLAMLATISGQVTAATAPLSGVTVKLSGPQTVSTTTDASGNYSFVVPADSTYTLTASAVGYSFPQPSQTLPSLTANQTVNFTAVAVTNVAISGQVTFSSNALPGVVLSVSGSQSGTATTDVFGNYTFTLATGGSYTITPALAGYTFSPSSQTFTSLSGNQVLSFTASPAPGNFVISGEVASGSAALPGVLLILGGSSPVSTTSDNLGDYSLSVPAGSYTLTPSLAGYSFVPPSEAFSNLNGNQSFSFEALPLPSVNAGGVVNAANYTNPVAPGSIVSAFGSFAPAAAAGTKQIPLPTGIGGVALQFGDGTNAPLFFVSASQVNFQVPWELAGQSQTTVIATVNDLASAPQTVPLAAAAPAIFTRNAAGSGPGLILDLSNKLVDGSNPVAVKSYVQIFATGLGPVTNTPASGAAAPFNPLSWTTTKPVVMIGNLPAYVQFSGLAPGYVGLYQLNVQIPSGLTANPETPVVVSIAGAQSNTVTIAVQ